MSKYHLFAFYTYYPNGGVDDYIGSYDTIKDASEAYEDIPKNTQEYHHGQIADENFKLVKVFNLCESCKQNCNCDVYDSRRHKYEITCEEFENE